MIKILAGVFLFIPLIANATGNVFDIYKQNMDFLTRNDTIITQNIANADTPKFIPKKLENKRSTFSYDIKLDTTNPMHFHAEESNSKYKVSNAEIIEIKPDGNAVSIENELLNKNQNSVKLNQVANMYNKAKNMMRYAITGSIK